MKVGDFISCSIITAIVLEARGSCWKSWDITISDHDGALLISLNTLIYLKKINIHEVQVLTDDVMGDRNQFSLFQLLM